MYISVHKSTFLARKEKVLTVVGKDPLDVTGIAQAAGLSPRIVRPVLIALHQEEKLEQEGEGKRNSPYRYRRAA